MKISENDQIFTGIEQWFTFEKPLEDIAIALHYLWITLLCFVFVFCLYIIKISL